MAANAETDSGSLDEVDPYVATPNSDIPIHQEDGSVASLEEIMTRNAETDSLLKYPQRTAEQFLSNMSNIFPFQHTLESC